MVAVGRYGRATVISLILPAGFGRLDFADWARGLISAVISGGASAVTSGFVVAMNDPVHYKPGTMDFLEVVGSVFIVSGVLNGMAFLRTKPIPDMKEVVTTVQKIEKQADPAATVVTTIKQTEMIPVKDPDPTPPLPPAA